MFRILSFRRDLLHYLTMNDIAFSRNKSETGEYMIGLLRNAFSFSMFALIIIFIKHVNKLFFNTMFRFMHEPI